MIVTPCPLCHLSLDAWQQKAEKHAGRELNMPILHLAQLLGAAAGIREDELKFKRHVVRPSRDAQEAAALPRAGAGGACLIGLVPVIRRRRCLASMLGWATDARHPAASRAGWQAPDPGT